jgi:hypothetical protein
MLNHSFSRFATMAAMVTSLLLAASCGGGTANSGVGSGGTGFINGVVTKGPVGGATVTAYAINGGQIAGQIGMATTDASGNFNLAIDAHAGPIMLQVSGGSYTDEATGNLMPMGQGDVMTVAMPTIAAGATTSGVQLTPITAMAQTLAQHMIGGMTDTNIAAANAALGKYFAISDIVHVRPMNPLVAGSGIGMSPDAQNYGMTLAAMSKYAQMLGLSNSSAIVTAMMNDAADGVMDGKNRASQISMPMGSMMGSSPMTPTAGTSDMAKAMSSFLGSAANASGMSAEDMAALIQKLASCDGRLQ